MGSRMGSTSVLVVSSRSRYCGLPVDHVVETFRPLPTEPLGQAPAFVRGMAQVRGEPVPVVDLAQLLGDGSVGEVTRYVSLRVGERKVALAVGAVLSLREIAPAAMRALPPLLAEGAPAVEALASLDAGLCLVLRAARLLPAEDLA